MGDAGGGDVRHRREGGPVVRGLALADRRDGLHAVRQPERLPGQVRQADALPVPGLPELLQPEDRDGHGVLEAAVADVGLGYLPGTHQSQGRVGHEAPPGSRYLVPVCMVHAPPDPGSVRRSAGRLRGARGSQRNLRGRQAEEHEHREAEGAGRHRPGSGREDSGRGSERPANGTGGRAGNRADGPGDPTGVRGRARQPGRSALTRTTRLPTRDRAGSTKR